MRELDSIAVVGAVMLARRGPRPADMLVDLPERPAAGAGTPEDATDDDGGAS